MLRETKTIYGNEVKLNKCPFCGNDAKLYIEDTELPDTSKKHIIRCDSIFCSSMTDFFSLWQPDYTKEVKKFIKKWNTRVHENKASQDGKTSCPNNICDMH